MPAPPLAQHLRLQHRVEYLQVQQLIPKLAVERLDVAILPGASGLDVEGVGWQNPIRIWSTDTFNCLGQPWGTMPSRTSSATISDAWLFDLPRDGWDIGTPQATVRVYLYEDVPSDQPADEGGARTGRSLGLEAARTGTAVLV